MGVGHPYQAPEEEEETLTQPQRMAIQAVDSASALMPPPARAIFQVTPRGPTAALVSISVTSAAVVFTDVRCPCGRKVMAIPGLVRFSVTVVRNDGDSSGRGRVICCGRCRAHLEIVDPL